MLAAVIRWKLERIASEALRRKSDEYWGGEMIHAYWRSLKESDKTKLENILLCRITGKVNMLRCGYSYALELINSEHIRNSLRRVLHESAGCTPSRLDIAHLLCLMNDADAAPLVSKLLQECNDQNEPNPVPLIHLLWRVDPEIYFTYMGPYLVRHVLEWKEEDVLKFKATALMNDFVRADLEIVKRLYSEILAASESVAHALGVAIMETMDRPREISNPESEKVQSIYAATRALFTSSKTP